MLSRCIFFAVVAVLAAAKPTSATPITVTSAVLAGPNSILCPPDGNCGTYTLTLSGTGASPSVATWMNYAVYQDEAIDDTLIDETAFSVVGDDTWSYVTQFKLCCKYGCEITGSYGSCWDSTAQVYALVEDHLGFDLKETNRLPVKCEIPEPASVYTVCFGLGLLALLASVRSRQGG